MGIGSGHLPPSRGAALAASLSSASLPKGLPADPDQGFARAAAADLALAKANVPPLTAHGLEPRLQERGLGTRRPQGSGAPCNESLLTNAYVQFQRELQSAMDITLETPPSTCKSCRRRWLHLNRADQLSNFLQRADNSEIEGSKPVPPMMYLKDTGRECNQSPCAPSLGAVCVEGHCLCGPGLVLDARKGSAKCVEAPDEVAGEMLGSIVSKAEGSEVSKLGQAWAATQRASTGARMEIAGELEPGFEYVPDDVAVALANTQFLMRRVAAYAFRCRSTAFLYTR